jgi:hypothetical protein
MPGGYCCTADRRYHLTAVASSRDACAVGVHPPEIALRRRLAAVSRALVPLQRCGVILADLAPFLVVAR